jgi:hypothetical protein
MNLSMTGSLADRFKSGSQRARVVTEAKRHEHQRCSHHSAQGWSEPDGRGADFIGNTGLNDPIPLGLIVAQIGLAPAFAKATARRASREQKRAIIVVRIVALQGLLASLDGFFGWSWEFAL